MKSTPVITSTQASMLIALAALCGGCANSSYNVQVDAITQAPGSGPTAPPQSYQIRVNNPNVDEDSLHYKEVAGYVKTALSGKGMYEAAPAGKADMVIEIDYGMETPRVKFETEAAPLVYLQQDEGIHYQEVLVYAGPNNPVGFKTVESPGTPARVEMLQTERRVRPVIVYEKYLKVSARSNQVTVEGRAPPEVWSVNVSSEDESKELRKYLPILASATADYIGTNTKQEIEVKLKEGDEVVGFIRKGI